MFAQVLGVLQTLCPINCHSDQTKSMQPGHAKYLWFSSYFLWTETWTLQGEYWRNYITVIWIVESYATRCIVYQFGDDSRTSANTMDDKQWKSCNDINSDTTGSCWVQGLLELVQNPKTTVSKFIRDGGHTNSWISTRTWWCYIQCAAYVIILLGRTKTATPLPICMHLMFQSKLPLLLAIVYCWWYADHV